MIWRGNFHPSGTARFRLPGVRRWVEARRVAGELVVVDSALREGHEAVEVQERLLKDGSRWEVYKRYFTADGLARELGGERIVHAGRWFVAVRA